MKRRNDLWIKATLFSVLIAASTAGLGSSRSDHRHHAVEDPELYMMFAQQGPSRWDNLDPDEKERVYRRYKKFQDSSETEQRNWCIQYYKETGRVPRACRKYIR